MRQVEATTRWLTAGMRGKRGTIERSFDLEAYRNRGERLYIVVDASPLGPCGVLQVEANLVVYFASPRTEADLKRFDLKLGDPAGQQVGGVAQCPRGTPPVGTQVEEQAAAPYGEGRFLRDAQSHGLNLHLTPTSGSYSGHG